MMRFVRPRLRVGLELGAIVLLCCGFVWSVKTLIEWVPNEILCIILSRLGAKTLMRASRRAPGFRWVSSLCPRDDDDATLLTWCCPAPTRSHLSLLISFHYSVSMLGNTLASGAVALDVATSIREVSGPTTQPHPSVCVITAVLCCCAHEQHTSIQSSDGVRMLMLDV